MQPVVVAGAVAAIALVGYAAGRREAVTAVDGRLCDLHSRPAYYGAWVALWCGLPALAVVAVWSAAQPALVDALVADGLPGEMRALPDDAFGLLMSDVRNLAAGGRATGADDDPEVIAAAVRLVRYQAVGNAALSAVAVAAALLGFGWARRRVAPQLRAREAVERVLRALLLLCSTIAILTTLGIVLSLAFESIRFFARVPVDEFLFGLKWSAQTAIRADQVGASGSFGAVPLFAGTLLITAIAMIVAAPIGLMSAVYLSEYADTRVRAAVKPALEVLAGVPTVVYGFFAAIAVAPLLRDVGEALDLSVDSESALAAGLVMGIMIVPFVSSLSDDVINAVPQSLRDGSYALGATRSETVRRVVLTAALPGIVAALLLAVSRAIGETMIVVMAAGLAANLTANPFEAVTTVTVQIVTLLVGDQEFDSAKTLAAFALGLTLFLVTLALNAVALRTVRRYREVYE